MPAARAEETPQTLDEQIAKAIADGEAADARKAAERAAKAKEAAAKTPEEREAEYAAEAAKRAAKAKEKEESNAVEEKKETPPGSIQNQFEMLKKDGVIKKASSGFQYLAEASTPGYRYWVEPATWSAMDRDKKEALLRLLQKHSQAIDKKAINVINATEVLSYQDDKVLAHITFGNEIILGPYTASEKNALRTRTRALTQLRHWRGSDPLAARTYKSIQ